MPVSRARASSVQAPTEPFAADCLTNRFFGRYRTKGDGIVAPLPAGVAALSVRVFVQSLGRRKPTRMITTATIDGTAGVATP